MRPSTIAETVLLLFRIVFSMFPPPLLRTFTQALENLNCITVMIIMTAASKKDAALANP